MRNRTLGIIGIIWLASAAPIGCRSLEPLTKDHVVEFKDQLSSLQFYISDDVVLTRVLRREERNVSDRHRIRIEEGKKIEEIVIDGGTPGVLAPQGSMPPDLLLINFEPPTDEHAHAIAFRYDPGGAAYRLEHDGWKVNYEDKVYTVVRTGQLLVDLEKVREVERERRALPGIRLPH